MRASYAAELFKMRKRAATWVLLGVWVALNLLFSFALPYASFVTGVENQETAGVDRSEVLANLLPDQVLTNALLGFPVFAGALALILGALTTGSEYGWGTWKALLTQRPGRLTILGGKLLALATAMLVAVAVTLAVGAVAGSLIATREGMPISIPGFGEIVVAVAAGWLILFTWCVLGAGLGVLFRGVALPIGLGVVWILGVQNLLAAIAENLLPGLRPLNELLPGANAGSLVVAVTSPPASAVARTPGLSDAVSGGQATLTLTLYVVCAAAAAMLSLRRRDVI